MSVDPVEMSAIVLRTVAGKEHVLYAPFTLDRLLRAATEQLHFHRESVKAVSQGRTVKLVDLCTNPEDLTRPLTPTELEMLVSRPATRPDYGSTAESSKKQSSTNSPSSTSGAAAMPCIILSGVPCSISRRAAKHDNTSVRSSANGPMASMPPSEGPVSTGGHQAPGASGNASVPVASSSSPGSSGPLQYPHSTTGITELAVLAESYDELCLHSFPWAMYEHPTMQHIIAMVNGDLTQLQHILAQVFDISSPLFDWFMRHSVLLVRMLNRSVPDDTLSINPLAHIAQQITGSLQAGQQTDFVLNVGGHELNLVLHVGNFDDGAVVEDEEASSMEWDSQEEAVQLNMLVEGLLGDELQNFQIEVVTGSEDDTESDGSSSSTPADSSDACEEEPSTSVASPLTAGTVITATQAVNLEDLAHAELSALIQQSQVEIQRALHHHATNRVLLTSAHTNLQSVSVVLMNELETNLDHVDHEKGFHWLVNAACTFYTTAESFYLTLIRELSTVEQQSIFGSDAVDSCAALACRAALGRQLYWEAVQLLEHSARLASQRVESLVSRAPRVGALRNLPTDCTPLIDACVSWIKGSGPKNLLQDLLNSSRAQRSTILWYCCTAAPEAPSASSSTTASVCYAICGVNGANAIHATQGLPRRGDRSSSTTPKGAIFPPTESELLACLERVRGSGASSPEDELAWTAMMQRSYASLVKPVEAILPPAGSSDLVYVVESTPLSSCSQPHVGSTRSLSPARWFPAYMDGAQLCLEKWCLVVSDSLWNVQLAAEAPVVNPKAQLRSIVLSEASQPTWLSPDITDALRFECCTLEGTTPKQSAAVIHVVRPSSTTPTTTTTTTAAVSSSASATHPVGDASSSPVVVLDWQPAAVAGDLLVVEAGNKSAAAVLQLAHRPQKARVVQQTAAMSAEDASLFFADFYAVLAGVVRMDADELTLAAAFQHAMVRVLNAHDHHAPWLATSFVLLDYGHQLDSLASAVGAQGRTLGESSPQTSAAPILPSIDQPEVALAYAKTHAVNDLYEVVLERLLSERPEEEIAIYENLIDSLNHVRRSKKRGGGEADPTSTARPAVEPAPQARQSSSEAPVASNASEGDLSIASPASPPAGPQPPRPPAQGKPGAGGRSNRRYFC